MEKGIPDEAFKAIEGDDKATVTELKKRNKKERQAEQISFTGMLAAEPPARYLALEYISEELNETKDSTLEEVRKKEALYQKLLNAPGHQRERLISDAWCAAFVWPKKPGVLEPITEEIFRQLEKDPKSVPSGTVLEARRLAEQYRFFHFHLAFPDVFHSGRGRDERSEVTGCAGGFDVVLGNPPWDKVQPEEQKFFANRRPDIATAPTGAQRKRLIAALDHEDPPAMQGWLEYKRGIEGASQLIKSSGFLTLTSRGNLNLYRLFAEHASLIVSDNGRVGMIVQTGLATDHTSKEFLQSMVSQGRLVRFLDFENRVRFFPDVDVRFRFALMTLRGRSEEENSGCVFGWLLAGVDEIRAPGRLVTLGREDFVLFNPASGTAPTFTSARDLEINRRIYSSARPVFVSKEDRYGAVDFLGELYNMTRDSEHFAASNSDVAEAPLYEAKFIHLFDHRFATSVSGAVRDVEAQEKRDATFTITPRYWVDGTDVAARVAKQGYSHGWMAGFRDVSSGTNERTAIFSVFPLAGVGNSINLLLGLDARQIARFIANANSFVFDYACRQKMSGMHVNIWIAKQLPAVPMETYEREFPWAVGPVGDWIESRVLELVYTAWDLEAFSRDCGYAGPPFCWDDDRRFPLRCELDAAFYHLYGVTREDVDHIMDTFPIVKRKDEETHGEYRTKSSILEIYDEMAEAIRTGEPYKTRLDPPPAHPSLAHSEV